MGATPMMQQLLARRDDVGRRVRRAAELAERRAGYEVLVGHQTVAGQLLTDLSLRTQYAHLTDALIVKIMEARPDTVIFLDKSARPVSWLVSSFWPISALQEPHGDADVAPRPRFCYLNIDREQWREVMDPDGSGGFDVTHVPAAAIAGLRRCFVAGDGSAISDEAVYDCRTSLSGQRVLVVDEVSVSGDTLRIACSLVSRAFPDAEISAAHWMTPRLVSRTGSRFNNQVPVWYREGTAFGRLVGDRNPELASRASSWRTQSAAWFLSLRHDAPDPAGVLLRSEAMQLLGDVVLGRLLLVPSFDRDPFDGWCQALTGMSPLELRTWREVNDIHLAP